MKIVILAGGGGTRLYPLSRSSYPKQFLKIDGEQSLLAKTISRCLTIAPPSDIIIVTNSAYQHHVQAELAHAKADGAHILLESVGRNTAPSVALSVRYCLDKLDCTKDEVILVMPSDHIIQSQCNFSAQAAQAVRLATHGKIVVFGIIPTKPETGYGYIHAGPPWNDAFLVKEFKEKPDQQTAKTYLESGDYYWNSGIFAFTIDCIKAEFEAYQPAIFQNLLFPYIKMRENFDQMPSISLDYAIAEHSKKLALIPFQGYWNDVGSWDAVYESMPKDESGNALKGDCLPLHCSNSLMISHSRLLACIGLENILVVETNDVIVVTQRGESQDMKELVVELTARGRKEATENSTVYRPWGNYTVIGEGDGYKLKTIEVAAGQKLSLQLHYHRSEHWVVIGGTAKVTVGESQRMVHKNESAYIPPSIKHRLENPGKLPLKIIEIQNGDYLEEDDIVRFEDNYGRI